MGDELARQAATALAGLLAARTMTRTDLARAMGISPGRVSQILSGDENLTLKSLATVAQALQSSVEITFRLAPPRREAAQDSPTDRPSSPYAPTVR
ncbi:helix-turn-helix domain-containing protein [Streptomyces beigongshangae]|uniref:helix-turn-helix domain-containing protein n=1 Tax=Streptomyces beigongshangae TaxID=2841597 RepID=UPI0021A481A1|nr:helix-turn-helix transcriptional regulator [Streptomyces sp. REN17]